MSAGDAAKLAKWDIIVCNKNQWDNDKGAFATTWLNIKNTNASAKVYNYECGTVTSSVQDAWSDEAINTLGRWDVARTSPLTALNADHPTYFLYDGATRLTVVGNYWVDFGNTDVRGYIAECYNNDFVGQSWANGLDGIYSDHNEAGLYSSTDSGTPDDYPTDAAWNTAMTSYVSYMTNAVDGLGFEYGCLRGESRFASGVTAWAALDAATYPPAFIFEEGFVVVGWVWGAYDAQIYKPSEWLNQINAVKAVTHSDVLLQAFTHEVGPGESGTDTYGKSYVFEDLLWYAMGSYFMVKENNVYFYFGQHDYNMIDAVWYDEYDYINIGNPVGDYYAKAVDGITLYMRKYDLGYVIVNPQTTDLSNVDYSTDLGLSGTFREITHANMATNPLTGIEASTQFATFKSHRAKILYSGLVVYDVSPIDGGAGYSITSSATWNHIAYVDDVEIWLDVGACDGTPDDAGADGLGDESSADADKTYDMSTLLENTVYCLTIVANAGAEQGEFQQFDFTTTTPAGLATCSYHSLGLTGSYDDQGATVGE